MLKRPMTMMLSMFMVLLATLLTACGGSSSASNSGTSSNGPITLNVWAMGTEGDSLKTLATDFTKANPNINVKVQSIPWSDAQNKLLTAVAGTQTPDITQMGTTAMAQFAKTGALDTTPGTINKNDFFKSAWNTTVFNGTSYGVPWYVDTRVLYYRTDIAEKAGIKNPPKTWDELLATAKAMKEKGGSKYGIYLANTDNAQLLPFIWQDGGQIFNNGKYTLDTPQTADALSFYQQFFKQQLTPASEPTSFDVVQSFVQGNTPMFISGPWNSDLIGQQGGSAFKGKWAIAPLPAKVTNTSFIGGANMVVFKNSPNREAAWKFVQYVSKPEVQAKWYNVVKDLPAVQSAWNLGTLASDKNLQVFHSQLSATQSPPATTNWEQVSTAINTDLEQVMANKMTPEQAGKDMQAKADASN